MRPDAPYFSNLLCQTLDDFTPQVESAATQWVNETINEMLIGGGGGGAKSYYNSNSNIVF